MGINGLNSVFSKKTYLESQPLVSQNVTFLGDKIFTEENEVSRVGSNLI